MVGFNGIDVVEVNDGDGAKEGFEGQGFNGFIVLEKMIGGIYMGFGVNVYVNSSVGGNIVVGKVQFWLKFDGGIVWLVGKLWMNGDGNINQVVSSY